MNADAARVTAARQGDRQAAADLVDRHAASVYGLCLSLLADADAAQDVAQDALLKAIDRLASLDEAGAFRPWLLTIARNLCRDYWKQNRRRRDLLAAEVGDNVGVALASGDGSAIPGLGTGPVSFGLPGEAEHADLYDALYRLPEKHRVPLFLYYFDGLSSARVAEALDISLSAACTRLCRARRALRAILEGNHD